MNAARAALLAAAAASVLVLPACEGRPRVAGHSGAGEEPSVGPYVAVFDLSDGAPEHGSTTFLGLAEKNASIEDVVRQAENLEHDAAVRGVLVRLGGARIGLGRAAELGALFAGLGAKRPVWCYGDSYDNDSLLLAARACRRVWVSPASSVDAIGIAAQVVYFHKLLADRLGLDVDFLQVGRFKGAEEPFTRDGPSDEARQSLESTLGDMRMAWLDAIRAGRPNVAPGTPEDGPYTAAQAKAVGLVDDVGYFDEARDALEKATGAVRAEVKAGSAAAGGGDDLGDAIRAVTGDSLSTAPVEVVRAVGAISVEGGGLVGGGDGIVARRLLATLLRIEHDDDVRAVVLRIDSPGGSALASDLLWHALMRLRSKKTLVVSVGNMAASGGYYLASTGLKVFADETSIVGSIGVVGGKIAVDRALDRLGVHAETFPGRAGDPQAATRSAYESLFLPWDDATRTRVLETMTGIYRLFLARVAEGRGIEVDRVAASAEGRIFSGRDAKARGLVDEIGGLREAIARARSIAGLPPDARVAVAGEATGLLRALGDTAAQGPSPAALVWPGVAAAFASDLAELAPMLDSLTPLAARERVACAVPFSIEIR